MWVARDKNGELWLYTKEKPKRFEECGRWDIPDCVITYSATLSKELYPELTWENEPLEVNIIQTNPKNIPYPVYWAEQYTNNSEELKYWWLRGWDKCREYIKNEFGLII